MEIIDTNRNSSFRIYYDDQKRVWYKFEEDWRKQTLRQRSMGNKGRVMDNIVFSARVIPVSHSTSRSGGSVYMKDVDDGYVYRMTQVSLHGLLMAIIIGEVTLRNGYFDGLFTFRAISDELAVDVYTGHYSDDLLAVFRGDA